MTIKTNSVEARTEGLNHWEKSRPFYHPTTGGDFGSLVRSSIVVQTTFYLLQSRMMRMEIGAHMDHKSFQVFT